MEFASHTLKKMELVLCR